jgi:hypothetical protein
MRWRQPFLTICVLFEATPLHRAIWGLIWRPRSFFRTNYALLLTVEGLAEIEAREEQHKLPERIMAAIYARRRERAWRESDVAAVEASATSYGGLRAHGRSP